MNFVLCVHAVVTVRNLARHRYPQFQTTLRARPKRCLVEEVRCYYLRFWISHWCRRYCWTAGIDVRVVMLTLRHLRRHRYQ